MTKIIRWNPDECQLFQGDVCAFRLPDDFKFSKRIEIDPRQGGGASRLVIAEGEISGHHHEILLGIKMPQPTSFIDEGMAHDIVATTPAPVATAKLYNDADAINRLVRDGHLTVANLALGILEVEGGPVMLQHPEHDTWQIPPGKYYFGGQREFDAEQERRVRD